jgi:hypothetical protein
MTVGAGEEGRRRSRSSRLLLLFNFLLFPFHSHPERPKTSDGGSRPWRLRGGAHGAAVELIAGARARPWLSAQPSIGPTTVPFYLLSLAHSGAAERRQNGGGGSLVALWRDCVPHGGGGHDIQVGPPFHLSSSIRVRVRVRVLSRSNLNRSSLFSLISFLELKLHLETLLRYH